MTAFAVYLNDKKLCVAGIGEDGVLDVIVDYVGGHVNQTSLSVGGLISSREHVRWLQDAALKMGDEVRVKVVESHSIDAPITRLPCDQVESPAPDQQKQYVREMAKKFGWTITES